MSHPKHYHGDKEVIVHYLFLHTDKKNNKKNILGNFGNSYGFVCKVMMFLLFGTDPNKVSYSFPIVHCTVDLSEDPF